MNSGKRNEAAMLIEQRVETCLYKKTIIGYQIKKF
jgi:hypothetical protein